MKFDHILYRKKMMNSKRIFSIAAVVALLLFVALGAYYSPAGRSYYSKNEYHTDLNYEDIEIEWVDEDAVFKNLDDYESAIRSGNKKLIITGYDRCLKDYEALHTELSLADLRYCCDIYNEEYAEQLMYIEDLSSQASNRFFPLTRDALNSSVGKALSRHIGDKTTENIFRNDVECSEEIPALEAKYMELVQEYDELYNEQTTVVIEGTEWDNQKLNTDNSLSQDDRIKIETALAQKRNTALASIYVDMVKVLNRKAKLCGYDNFADYAYKEVFCRDYTKEDIRKVYEGVRKSIVPLKNEIAKKLDGTVLNDLNPDGEEIPSIVGPVIGKIHPELRQAWDYMLEHHFYDIEDSPGKISDNSFSEQLYSYGTPFMLISPRGDRIDIYTFIHEFGHFNEGFHGKSKAISYVENADVTEIHSQALELLCLAYADELYGKERGYQAELDVLFSKMNDIIYGCIFDEFQYMAFTYDGDLTVDELDRIYLDIYYDYFPDNKQNRDIFWWTECLHLFEYPMLYISYTTSTLASFDIYAMSTEDWDAAVDCYMKLTTHHGEEGYRETLHEVGLPDIFEDGVIEDIANNIRKKTLGIEMN